MQSDYAIAVPNGLVLSGEALHQLKSDLGATGWDRFTVADFKERFHLTRKWAIPVLEHLDSVGITRRLGDQRQLVQGGHGHGS